MTEGAIGARPSQDLPELQGRSVSSAVSAMHPERRATAKNAAKPQRSFAVDFACGRFEMVILVRNLRQSAKMMSFGWSLSCSQLERMSQMM